MEKEVKLFDKRFVHFMWDDELKGKKVFLSNDIDNLRGIVEKGTECDLHSVISSGDESAPFESANGVFVWQFAYYDPNYEVKKAFNEGKTIQFKFINGVWEDILCEENLIQAIEENIAVRVKPECPCEDGIDSKACVGCPQDEARKAKNDELWYVIFNMNMQYEICRKCPKSGLFSGTREECEKWVEEHEPRKTCRPFKDCDELVEFWTKNYQTVLRPANTKPLIWVRLKCDGRERLIVAFGKGFGSDFVEIGNKAKAVPLLKLFDDYEFLDGKPCGAEVKE